MLSHALALVLACSSLACLQLIKVPSADCERTLVFVHASLEVGDIVLADLWCAVGGVVDGTVVSLSKRLVDWSSGLR